MVPTGCLAVMGNDTISVAILHINRQERSEDLGGGFFGHCPLELFSTCELHSPKTKPGMGRKTMRQGMRMVKRGRPRVTWALGYGERMGSPLGFLPPRTRGGVGG